MNVASFDENVCDGFDTTYRPHERPHNNMSFGAQCGSCRVVLEDNWFKRVHE